MGIRTGAEYRARLRDGRTVYVNGERVNDVTTYSQRGIWWQWKKVMSQGVEVPTRRRGNGASTTRRAAR